MTGSVNNNYNPQFTNPPVKVGVLQAPDDHFKPVLYSHTRAGENFKRLSEDIYIQQKNTKPEERHKTPKSVLCILGATALTGLFFPIRHLICRR